MEIKAGTLVKMEGGALWVVRDVEVYYSSIAEAVRVNLHVSRIEDGEVAQVAEYDSGRLADAIRKGQAELI